MFLFKKVGGLLVSKCGIFILLNIDQKIRKIEEMASIDISGIKGKRGMDGHDGHQYGECGQGAGPSEDGGHGGVAYLRITRVLDRPSAIQAIGTVHNSPFN